MSLDALRGFTMLWIVGADAVGQALSNLRGGPVLHAIAEQFDHVPWEGLRFFDLIMPLFLFMVGAAIPYSMDKTLAQDTPRRDVIWRIVRRTILLFVLGVIYYHGFANETGQLRLAGTLQRIAVCYCIVSLIYLARPSTWALIGVTVGILLAYWAMMALVPVPGYGAGDYAPGHNLANWFDSKFLPGRKWNGDYDPEGLLSTLCAVSTVLMGVLAGRLLKRPDLTQERKAALLAVAGVACVAVGLVWAIWFPIIKQIWTSSYALLTGGCSLLFLALFYWVIDIRERRTWALPFVWLGTNALLIYMVSNIVEFGPLTRRVISGPVAAALESIWPGLAGLTVAVISMILCILLCRFLYQRKIFIKL